MSSVIRSLVADGYGGLPPFLLVFGFSRVSMAPMAPWDASLAQVADQAITAAHAIQKSAGYAQPQWSDQGPIDGVVRPAQVLPGTTRLWFEEVGDIHDQPSTLMEHHVASVHVVAMQAASLDMGERRIHVGNRLGRDQDALLQAVVESGAVQSPQHQVAIPNGEALREGRMEADLAIHLGLLVQPRSSRAVDLHHQIRMLGMVEHCGVIPAAQHAPGLGELHNRDWIMGIRAMDLQVRKQLVVNARKQFRNARSCTGMVHTHIFAEKSSERKQGSAGCGAV